MFSFVRRGRSRSIQFWLTWLIIACILPATVGTAFLLVRSYEVDRANLETARIGVARALMQAVDGELADGATVLQVLAQSPLIASGNVRDFQDLATRALETTSATTVVLLLPDGRQIMNTLKPYGTSLPVTGSAQLQSRTLKSGKLTISGVFSGAVTHRPLVALQMPIRVNGDLEYILEITFQSESLGEILLRQNMPPGWVAALLDQNGVVAARTVAAERFVGRPGSAEVVKTIARLPEGALATHNLEGKPVHVTFSRSAYSGWAVAIAIPAEVATAELKHSLLLNGAGAVAALLLTAGLARGIGHRITRSITVLMEPALTLGSGALFVLPPVDITEVDALRTVLLQAAELVEERARERDAAKDAERRMLFSAEAAEQASRAKSDFLASMSHELRTPLHGILGYAEMMRLEGSLTPTNDRRVGLMLGAGQHLLTMINAVLDMSQIEANRLELQPAEVALSDLASACLDVVRPTADLKGLALVLTSRVPLRLVTDPTRLRQVLVNLLGNAIKFTRTGSVELCLRPCGSSHWVRLEVIDTGPGIPPGHRDKLFRTFERLDGKALVAVEGAGLGLSLSARLVKLMGGRLGYDDNPTGGSIFWLELPRGDVVAAPSDLVTATSRPDNQTLADKQVPARTQRVLVVDDVAINRDIARAFLAAAGHQVTCVGSGREAVTAVMDREFDVILMDVRMPGMDGLEATRCIRAIGGVRGETPIVGLTAAAFIEQISECRAAGMNSHLGKPFDQPALVAAVTEAARLRPSGASTQALLSAS